MLPMCFTTCYYGYMQQSQAFLFDILSDGAVAERLTVESIKIDFWAHLQLCASDQSNQCEQEISFNSKFSKRERIIRN